MFTIIKGLSLVALTLATTNTAFACDLPKNRPHRDFRTVDNFINTKAFVNHVRNTIGNDVMGYAAILRAPSGKKIAQVSHGWAQSPCEPGGAIAYSGDTVTPWASVTKMVTAAAVLNKIRRSSARRLDERMIDHMPERWTVDNCDGTSTCWSDVEIRHMLSYKAGFKNTKPLGWEGTLALPATQRPVGKRRYENEHFSAWHYMGSFFAAGRMADFETAFEEPDSEYEDYIFASVRQIWNDYLKREIFDPIGIRAACGDVGFAGANFALLYDYRTPASDGNVGKQVNSISTPNCTSGGIVMSVNDMSKFTHALAKTGKIISRKQYNNRLKITNKDVFGWNNDKEVDDGRVWYKAGGAGKPQHVGTHMLAFSSGYTAVIAMNSFQRDSSIWKRLDVLIDAYEAGIGSSTGVLTTE